MKIMMDRRKFGSLVTKFFDSHIYDTNGYIFGTNWLLALAIALKFYWERLGYRW